MHSVSDLYLRGSHKKILIISTLLPALSSCAADTPDPGIIGGIS